MVAARLIGCGAAALYAAAALASGADRISEQRPGIASSVPEPLRTHAARALVTQAITNNRPEAALAEAQRAVLNDPIDARSTAALGQAYLFSGNEPQARRAFDVSGQLGWREPSTQLFWMMAALAAGNHGAAALRLDAVLRQAPRYEGRNDLLALLENSGPGRAALAQRLAEKPGWAPLYFEGSDGLSPKALLQRSQVAGLLAFGKPGERNCEQVAPLVQVLARDVDYGAAFDAWQPHCQRGGETVFPADPGFEAARLDRPLTPFDWRFADDGAINTMLEARPGFSGVVAAVSSRAPGVRSFARAALRLRPGGYRVRWRALDESGAPASAVSIALECADNRHRAAPAKITDARRGLHEARVSASSACTTHWLSLGIAPGRQRAFVDDVEIVPE